MYRYVGGVAYLPGVPMRDLSDEEYKAIPEHYKAAARKMYKKARAKKPAQEG